MASTFGLVAFGAAFLGAAATFAVGSVTRAFLGGEEVGLASAFRLVGFGAAFSGAFAGRGPSWEHSPWQWTPKWCLLFLC